MPEDTSPKAARILAAAGDLFLSRGTRGFTIADVAQKAHVGKGTVYLYWTSKEDLLLGLIGRDFVALADELLAALAADPALVFPAKLGPLVLQVVAGHPYVRALQSRDELLGVLADDPRAASLLETLGPIAVLHRVLPVWREHGLARRDWPTADQALAIHALMTGFVIVAEERSVCAHPSPAAVLATSTTALLGPERPDVDVSAAATDQIRVLQDARGAALAILGVPSPSRASSGPT